jgi:hypothetical protein
MRYDDLNRLRLIDRIKIWDNVVFFDSQRLGFIHQIKGGLWVGWVELSETLEIRVGPTKHPHALLAELVDIEMEQECPRIQ